MVAKNRNEICVAVLGNVQKEKKHQSGNVYSWGGIAPNIMAGTHGYGFGYIMEVTKCKKY